MAVTYGIVKAGFTPKLTLLVLEVNLPSRSVLTWATGTMFRLILETLPGRWTIRNAYTPAGCSLELTSGKIQRRIIGWILIRTQLTRIYTNTSPVEPGQWMNTCR